MASFDDQLIGGAFEVCANEALADFGGGLPAFAVRDHRQNRRDLMAVQVAPDAPPRPLPLSALGGEQIENLLLPLTHGRAQAPGGGQAWFVIGPRPPGPPLMPMGVQNVATPWSERDLLDFVLRPASLALDQLSGRGVTHRAIRPGNVFQRRQGQPVTLGFAWAAPPASLQPALFEPPYSAMCHPAGRGDGSIADDIYALGVLLVVLAGGVLPMAGLDAQEVTRRKLERGSFAALTAGLRLPATIADLARGMLAEDPEHRPPPVLLADPQAARARRVAARPPQRAQGPLELGTVHAWDARMLAFALARAPGQGLRMLRGLEIGVWLRRGLGDPLLAARIEDVVRSPANQNTTDLASADSMVVMRCVAILDPLAPLCWRGMALFPDGIGTLAAFVGNGGPPDRAALHEPLVALVQSEAASFWGDMQGERIDAALLQLDTRQQRVLLRIGGWAGGLARLRYGLNPLLACRSPLVGSDCVVRLHDLLPALERHGATTADFVIDQEVAAFISARFKGRMDSDFTIISQDEDPDIDPPGHRGLAQLRVLARLSDQEPSVSWPHLASCALRVARAALGRWGSRSLRASRASDLEAAAARGALMAMITVLDDSHASAADAQAVQAAESELRAIDVALARLAGQTEARGESARNTGQEIAAALGVMALAISAMTVVLS